VVSPVVCVVGAGTPGLEALLSARAQIGPRAELRLIAPDREFRYRPMSADSLFRPARERALAIGDLVARVGATWIEDRAEAVYEDERSVLTRDGDTVSFDYLLLVPGTRSKRTLRQGYVWERGGDPGFLDQIILELAAGAVRSVAVVVPRGARWPLPAYELALVLAWTASGTAARIVVVTAEERPLGALGTAAASAVAHELDAAGVEMIAGVEVTDPSADEPASAGGVEVVLSPEEPADQTDALTGMPTSPADSARVRLGADSVVEFDRLISLPTAVGPRIAGVATDAVGYVEVDAALRVCGSERVWAAGACIAAALEHSALAAEQADAAITAIAAAIGGGTCPPVAPELTGVLLTGQRDNWLAENPAGTREPSTRCLWWPPGRAVGRMLAQQIAAWDPAVHDALPSHPTGVLVRAPVALGCNQTPLAAGAQSSADVRAARLRDIENRQLMAIKRHERAADAELGALREGLETLTAHQLAAVGKLKAHGYLHDRR
jgi:sulfide:quinone oxidoreductase